jgi:hypothetical protein
LDIPIRIGIYAQHVDAGHLLAGHEGEGAVRVEPNLCRAVDGRHEPQDRSSIRSARLPSGALDIEDRDPVFAPERDPQFLAAARERRFMRFASNEDAGGHPFGVGRCACGWIGYVADDAFFHRIDQVDVARAAAARGEHAPVGRRHCSVGIYASVVERLVDHRRMRWGHAGRHKPERRARVLIETCQVDGRIDGVARRIDDAQGIGVFVGDENPVFALDGWRTPPRRAIRLGLGNPIGQGRTCRSHCHLQKFPSVE